MESIWPGKRLLQLAKFSIHSYIYLIHKLILQMSVDYPLCVMDCSRKVRDDYLKNLGSNCGDKKSLIREMLSR